jgi:putative endonuclease
VDKDQIGFQGEQIASQFLVDQGYAIRARNWRVREGELDIVAEEDGIIVFVEVKTRRSRKYGYPEEAITAAKRRRLLKAAFAYLEEHQLLDREWRFDVIAIECSHDNRLMRMDHYKNVIEGEEGLQL